MSRLLIFNLPREASEDAVRALVDGWRRRGRARMGAAPGEAQGEPDEAEIDLHTIPGADSELFAVVHLEDDLRQLYELARHLNGCRRVGGLPVPRPLWTWLPAMAWA